jgi:hypothetical protein
MLVEVGIRVTSDCKLNSKMKSDCKLNSKMKNGLASIQGDGISAYAY